VADIPWWRSDHVDDATLDRLSNVLSPRSLVVHSGREGNRHVYPKLDAVYPPGVIEELNEMLDRYLGGDGKFAENTVLRVPGPSTHKGRAAGVRLSL